jgi:hypothetical protein
LEAHLAARTEALSRVEAARLEDRNRFEDAELGREEVNARLEAAVREKGNLESALAEKTALLSSKSEAAENLSRDLAGDAIDSCRGTADFDESANADCDARRSDRART